MTPGGRPTKICCGRRFASQEGLQMLREGCRDVPVGRGSARPRGRRVRRRAHGRARAADLEGRRERGLPCGGCLSCVWDGDDVSDDEGGEQDVLFVVMDGDEMVSMLTDCTAVEIYIAYARSSRSRHCSRRAAPGRVPPRVLPIRTRQPEQSQPRVHSSSKPASSHVSYARAASADVK